MLYVKIYLHNIFDSVRIAIYNDDVASRGLGGSKELLSASVVANALVMRLLISLRHAQRVSVVL